MNVGDNIRKYRIEKDMSITMLAKLVESSREYISAIEHNRKAPSFTLLDKIAVVLDVSVNDLTSADQKNVSPELNKLLENAKQLHPSILGTLNNLVENINSNYKLISKSIKGINTEYIVDLNIKPNGLTDEEELEAQELIHRLKELQDKEDKEDKEDKKRT